MSEPLAPELEQKAQELASRIRIRSADAILDMARRLVATTDETLFGETEFALRDSAQGVVADAYAEHLEKKVATSVPVAIAPSADTPPPSTATARKRSKQSAARSPAAAPTTTAARAALASAPGTVASD
jgi:hypothetical protein